MMEQKQNLSIHGVFCASNYKLREILITQTEASQDVEKK